jgi:uncharacterized protein
MSESETDRWGSWGPLAKRYHRPGPKRILALDGGGIRGVLTLEVLARIEALLRERYQRPELVLSEFFEYIGGTSTGAIIAAALARGMSVAKVQEFYLDFGEKVFQKRSFLQRINALYESGPLERKLREVFGGVSVDHQLEPGVVSTLEPDHLKTLLLIVTRNATTDSVWPVSSNPDAKYNALSRSDSNLKLPLWKLVRASAAAPVYFESMVIELDGKRPDKDFVFVDGATTAYNCPAFLMARMATEPAYNLGWKRDERSLLVVSLGTGGAPVLGHEPSAPSRNVLANVGATLSALISQAQFDQDINCRTIGRCTHGARLDSEVGDLIPRDAAGAKVPVDQDLGKAFLYARYDALLTSTGLGALGLSHIDAAKVARLDGVDAIGELGEVGRAVAKEVSLEHFGRFADPELAPVWTEA